MFRGIEIDKEKQNISPQNVWMAYLLLSQKMKGTKHRNISIQDVLLHQQKFYNSSDAHTHTNTQKERERDIHEKKI